ncbi:hypothetical protein ASPZODRAFT_52168, partial [Penicilliopsis zonata CBS 506.65]
AQVTLVRRCRRLRLASPQQFRNSLLAGVGYLELANAGDFAANVWNTTPLPRFAVALMAIGGSAALLMSFVAVRDLWLSWRNVQLLRAERSHLQQLLQQQTRQRKRQPSLQVVAELETRIGVNTRELGSEIIDRIAMDILMGSGSILVGVGTIMAIWGADRRIFLTSNLLSGYIGNGLPALFGVVNAGWSAYLWRRFSQHDHACSKDPSVADFRPRLHLRFCRFKWHACINGVNGVVAGAASLVTATHWQGYVVLVLCIVTSILCNYFWRYRLGYDRPLIMTASPLAVSADENQLLTELQAVTQIHQMLVQQRTVSLPLNTTAEPCMSSILRFLVENDLFPGFCEWLAKNPRFPQEAKAKFFPPGEDFITIATEDFLKISEATEQLLLESCRQFLSDAGIEIFTGRERYLLELVGYSIWRD